MPRPKGREVVASQDVAIEARINPTLKIEAIDLYATDPETSKIAFEDVWELGGTYIFPAVADTFDIESAAAADNAAGIGATLLRVQGLDADYNKIEEFIVPTGTTPVTTALSYIRLYSVVVVTAGSNGENVGQIDITHTGTSDTLGIILQGQNQTQLVHFTAAATGDFVLYRISISHNSSDNVSFRVQVRPQGGTWQSTPEFSTVAGYIELNVSTLIPPKADFRIRCLAGGAGPVSTVTTAVAILCYK